MPPNAERRTLILDAAIDLLCDDGVGGLTHRQLDSRTGLPAGTTSNYFRTRQALLEATASRTVDLHWQRVEALQQRATQFRTRETTAARDFEYTRQMTLAYFNRQITPIVREVMEQHGANVVIDDGMTRLVMPGFNVTDEVVQRLNQRLRTINVTWQTAPAQQQGQ